jgi:hypothetical protein
MKTDIKKLTTLTGLLTALVVSSLQSQISDPWQEVETWDSFAPGTYTGPEDNLPHPMASNGGAGQVDIFEDIEGANGNAAWVWYGEELANRGDAWHQIALPTPVAQNTRATLYFRLWQATFEHNMHIMVSKVPAGDEPDNTALWGNQAAIMRFNPGEPAVIESRNGGSYVPSNPDLVHELTDWYEYWMVLDNSYDSEGNQAGVGGYEIYVRGPGETTPRLLTWGGETTVSFLDFRNQAQAPLETVVLHQNSVFGSGTWLIDDLFLAPGEVLTSPYEPTIAEEWCGFEKVGSDVNTGDWMGWLNVGDATTAPGFAYSYGLDSYVYIGSCPDSNGAWTYVFDR